MHSPARLGPIVLGCWLAACADASGGAAVDASGTSSGGAPSSATNSSAIESSQVDGVWIFLHQSTIDEEARFAGAAEVVNGCLRVGEQVVVWRKSDADQVRSLIESLKDQPSRAVVLGGGEATAFGSMYAEMTELCPTSSVWFSARLQDGWLVE